MADRTVEAMFAAALERTGEARAAWLRDLATRNAALAAEVQSLLDAHARAGAFLESQSGAPADDPLLGRRLGAYRLTRLLGAGGAGRVYLGERVEGGFSQRVAIKIVVLGAFAGDAQRRFRNECRALARLEHPHITRLLDGGITPESLPYIVMEYVEGTALDRYCDEHGLALRDRLRLMRDVCAAVEHAHRHSILHRDIKPANILVDASGCAKLADFGIARLLDAARDGDATATCVPLMTPTYASPEQLAGEPLSTASDVYSLGLVLYRMLTGVLPHDGAAASPRDLARLAATTTPRRPSEALRRREDGGGGTAASDVSARALAGDLDAIVMMALRREPERRYASARHLADDLARHLAGMPVLARPDSLRYRAAKFARRHALGVTAAATGVLMLAGAAATGFTLYARADSARRDAVAARAEAENARRRAQRVGAALIGIVESADPLHDQLRDPSLREVLAAAARRLDVELAAEPAVASAVHRALGLANINLLDLAAAEHHLARAGELLQAPDAADPAELMATLTAQGRLAFAREQKAAATAALQRAIALGRADSLRFAAELTEAEIVLAHVLANLGEPLAAEPLARSALARSEAIADPRSRLPTEAANELGVTLLRLGRVAEAEQAMRLAIARARPALGDRHHLVGVYLGNLALALRSADRGEEAVVAAEEALAIFSELYPEGHAAISQTRISLADALQTAGRRADAIPLYQQALADLAARLGEQHSSIGVATNNLGYALSWAGDTQGAAAAFARAAAIYRATLGSLHPELAGALANLAQATSRLGDHEAAERHCREALAILAGSLPDDHFQTAWTRTFLAHLRLAAGDAGEAHDLLRAALPPLRATVPAAHFARVDGEILLARAWRQLGDAAAAADVLIAAHAAADSTAGADDPGTRRLAAALAEF